jgi:hypothetical protein
LEGGLLHAAIECGQRRQRYLVFLTAKNILHIYLLDTSLAPLDHAMLGFCGDPQISHFELLQGNRLSFRLPSEEGIAWRLTLWAIPWLRWTIWSLLFPANREVWRPYKRWLRPYFGIERLISSATSTKEQ